MPIPVFNRSCCVVRRSCVLANNLIDKGTRAARVAVYLFAVSTLSLSACTPTTSQVGSFGEATATLAEQARAGFENANEAVIQRRMLAIAADPASLPDDTTFVGLATRSQLEPRLAVLDKLGEYASALKALHEADTRTEVEEASSGLYSALNGLSDTFGKLPGQSGQTLLSKEEAGLIATIVDAAGVAINELKKRQAIKHVIDRSDKAVSKACAALASDLGVSGAFSVGMLSALNTSRTEFRLEYVRQRGLPQASLDSRMRLLEQLRRSYAAYDAAGGFTQSIDAAIQRVQSTHEKLAEAVRKDTFTSADLIVAVNELSASVNSVRKFREKLSKES